MDYFLALLCSVNIFIIFFISKKIFNTWFSPAGIFSGVWGIGTISPLIFAPEYYVSVKAYLIVSIIVMSVFCGAFFWECYSSHFFSRFKSPIKRISFYYWGTIYNKLTLFSFLAPIIFYIDAVRHFGTYDVIKLAPMVAAGRYTQEFTPDTTVIMLVSVIYLTSLLGGLLKGLKKVSWFKSLVWILPISLMALISTGRAGLLYTTIFWITGFITVQYYLGKIKKLKLYPIIFSMITMGVGVFLFFLIFQLLRWNSINFENIISASKHLKLYFFGHMAGLGVWIDDIGVKQLHLGTKLFPSLFEFLGLSVREQGFYTEPVLISKDSTTNIYTIIRPLLEDFGTIGSFIVSFFYGLLGQVGFISLEKGYWYGSILLIVILPISLMGLLASIFGYNSTILVVMLFALMVIFLSPLKQRLRYRLIHE